MKLNGGIGIIDLGCQNDALLIKWLWSINNNSEGLWASTLRRLYGIISAGQVRTHATSSSFLKELTDLLPFFNISVVFDPLTLKWRWRWSTSDTYTCASAYQMMHHTGEIAPNHKILWKMRVPLKVRVYLWLMLENKILTQEILQVRGCNVASGCHMCHINGMETTNHIMWECNYVRLFWRGLCAHYNIRWGNRMDARDLWLADRANLTPQERVLRRIVWAAGSWAIWRERNRRLSPIN